MIFNKNSFSIKYLVIASIVFLFILNFINSQAVSAQTQVNVPGDTPSDYPVKIYYSGADPDESDNEQREEDYDDIGDVRIDNVQTNILEVSDTINDLSESTARINSQIQDQLNKGINDTISNLSNTSGTQGYEYQRDVDRTRADILNDISDTLNNGDLTDSDRVVRLESDIQSSLDEIESDLESRSGQDVSLDESRRSIRDTLLAFSREIEEKRQILKDRQGDLIFEDTDNDGLSDYDEKFIYNTDPENANTSGGNLNDSEKILNGINPVDPDQSKIEYEDPRENQTSVISDLYKVTELELMVDSQKEKSLTFRGRALPNSLVTVYVFSTPIVATVKANENGSWQYTLEQELEDGNHEVYVATINNSGKIVARSDTNTFTKTAQAATLGAVISTEDVPETTDSFFKKNFLLMILGIILVVVILTLMLIGRKSHAEVINDIKNEVNQNPLAQNNLNNQNNSINQNQINRNNFK